MFIPKFNLKQKRVKKTQERETGSLPLNNSRGEHNYSLWRAHIWTTRYGEQDHSPMQAKTGSSRETKHFSPKNPNFNFPMPKFDSKSCLIISKHEKSLEFI